VAKRWSKAFDERRRVIVDLLNRIPGRHAASTPGGAFYAFPNIDRHRIFLSAKALQTRLLEQAGVAT
jgi:aspartate/methionine/tyrosine aminotransferase